MIDLKNTRLLGHRGARSEALENTLFGFQHAQRLQPYGLAGIELDVQLTADGHLVMFHDENLQRLCGMQSRIDQLNLAETQRHLQNGHPIITLDQLAQVLHSTAKKPSLTKPQKRAQPNAQNANPQNNSVRKNGLPLPALTPLSVTTSIASQPAALAQFTHIELELKTHNRTNYAKYIQALTRYLIDSPLTSLPILLTSFDVQLLAQLQRHQLLTHIPRGLLIRSAERLESAPNTALQLGCSQLGIYYPLLTPAVIQQCHRYGLPVSAWTVNYIEHVKQLIQWQVDVIITDIPTQLLSEQSL